MIRRAIAGSIPGINLSSFSVAVLMSNLAGNNLSFFLVLGGEAAGDAVSGTLKRLGIVAADAVGTLDPPIFAAQPPSLCCFASASSSSSFCRSAAELEAPGGVTLRP